MTAPITKSIIGLAAVVILPVLAFSADLTKPSLVVVTTASGERFIGTPGLTEAGCVHLVSQTLGEIRIPQADIRSMVPQNAAEGVQSAPSAAPVATTAAPAAPAMAAKPTPGLLQSWLHVPGKFSASLGVGLMAQSGLLEQKSWTSSVDLGWELDDYTISSQVQTQRQKVNGTVIMDGLRWDTLVRRKLDAKRFIAASSNYREDQLMAIQRQEVLFAGVGLDFAKAPTLEMLTIVGPAYIWQRYISPAPGVPPAPDLKDPAGVFFQSISYTKAPGLRLSASGLIAQSFDNSSKQLAWVNAALDVALSDRLILSTSYMWTVDSMPRFGATKYEGTLTTQLKLKL